MSTEALTPEIKSNALAAWRASVFSLVIRFIAYAGTFTYFILMGFLFEDLKPIFFISYTSAYILILVSAFVTRIPIVYRAYSLVLLVYSLAVFSAIEKAAAGDSRVWFITSAVFAAVFLGRRAGIGVAVLGTLTWGGIGILFGQNTLVQPEFNQFSVDIWGGTTVTLLMAGVAMVLSIGALLNNLNKTIEEGFALTKKAEEQSKELEEQRNALERRSDALERSAKISRKVAGLTSSNSILIQAPIMIKNEFDLLSVAFFSLENDSRLHLASCEGWNEQAYPKHDYAVSLEDDIVGAAVTRGEAVSNKNYEKGLIASMPATHSFASIPMRGRSSNITGALLIQSEDAEGMGTDRLATLQMLADQIAILMENTDLLAAKESALEAERRAYGDITESAWADFMQNQNYSGYMRNKDGLQSISPSQPHEHLSEDKQEVHQVPIRLRNRVIGHIDAQKPTNRAWTASERELLNTLAGRLENALDSARLYEEIQERATRERLVSEVSTKMRESLDVQAVLKAAAEELHKVLGDVAETEIWISPEEIREDEPTED